MTKTTFLKHYNSFSAAHNYLVFFLYKKNLYMAECGKIQPRWVVENYETYGHTQKYMISLKNQHKEQLIRKGAKLLMTESEFMAIDVPNRGRKCEKWLHETTNQDGVYKYDTVPFNIDGDITINGIKYQVKFQNASLANVRTIEKLKKERREK